MAKTLCAQAVRCHVPTSAGLAPVGSQLASYNKRTVLSRSPLGLPRWKQRLVSYSAGTRLRIRSYFPNVPTSSMKRYAGFIPCTLVRLLRSEIRLGLSCSVPDGDRVVAPIRTSRKESFFQQVGLRSLKLLVPLGQAQRKPKTIRWASGPSAPAQAGGL